MLITVVQINNMLLVVHGNIIWNTQDWQPEVRYFESRFRFSCHKSSIKHIYNTHIGATGFPSISATSFMLYAIQTHNAGTLSLLSIWCRRDSQLSSIKTLSLTEYCYLPPLVASIYYKHEYYINSHHLVRSNFELKNMSISSKGPTRLPLWGIFQ